MPGDKKDDGKTRVDLIRVCTQQKIIPYVVPAVYGGVLHVTVTNLLRVVGRSIAGSRVVHNHNRQAASVNSRERTWRVAETRTGPT